MKIAVLGSGMVGQTIAGKLCTMHHDIHLGTRDPEKTLGNDKANQMTGKTFKQWHDEHLNVHVEPFAEVCKGAHLIINATSGMATLEVLETVGRENLQDNILIDIANPLDFSNGFPPTLNPVNEDSLGEQIQKKYPKAKVVKTLNTMNAFIMVNPDSIEGDHNVFLSGNDSGAKDIVRELLHSIGWKDENIIDLGDISTARGTEMLLPIWLRLYGAYGHANFNFHIQKG